MWEFYMASWQRLDIEIVVFQLQIVKNFQSAHVQETIYIHKKCYLINSHYEKGKKNFKYKKKQ